MTGTTLGMNHPILESLPKANVADVMLVPVSKLAMKKVLDPKLVERKMEPSRDVFTHPRTYPGQLCISAESKLLTNSEVHNYIDGKVAFFLSSGWKSDGRKCLNEKPLIEESRKPKQPCPNNIPNSLPLVHGRNGLKELHDFTNDCRIEIEMTPFSGEENNGTKPTKDSSGRQGGHTRSKSVDHLSLSQHCDWGYNISTSKCDKRKNSMNPIAFHMTDTVHYPLNTLKELIASLENAETCVEMNNFTKFLVNDYWNGDVDNIHIFASTEYPKIMLDVAATCTKNEDESPVVLKTCSGLNQEVLIDERLGFAKMWTLQTEYGITAQSGIDKKSLSQETKEKYSMNTFNMNHSAADALKDKCSEFGSTTICNPEKEYNRNILVGQTRQDLKNPIYEDISDYEETRSPLCQNMNCNSQLKIMKSVASQTQEDNHHKPLCVEVCTDKMNADDEWKIIPLSVESLNFLPKYKSNYGKKASCSTGDGSKFYRSHDSATDQDRISAPSVKSSLQIFDTIDSFEKAQVGKVGIFEVYKAGAAFEEHCSSRPNSDLEDSCETEDSCDYSSDSSDQNRLTVSKKLLNKIQSNSLAKTTPPAKASNSRTCSPISKKRQFFKTIEKLIKNSVKPKRKTNEAIVIDSDPEDGIDDRCRKSSGSSVGGKKGQNIVELISTSNEAQDEDSETSVDPGHCKHRISPDASNTSVTCKRTREINASMPPSAYSESQQSLCNGAHSRSQKGQHFKAWKRKSKLTARKSTGVHTFTRALELIKRARRTDSTTSEDDRETLKSYKSRKIKKTTPKREILPEVLSQRLVERNANPDLNSVIPCLFYQISLPSGHIFLTTRRVLREKVVCPISLLTSESSSDELGVKKTDGTEPNPVIKGPLKGKRVFPTKGSNIKPLQQETLPKALPTLNSCNRKDKDSTDLFGKPTSTFPSSKSVNGTCNTNPPKLQRSISSPAEVDARPRPFSSFSTLTQVPAHVRIRDEWKSQHIQTYKERRRSQSASLSKPLPEPSKTQAAKKRPSKKKTLTPLMKKTKKMCLQEKKRCLPTESSFPVGDGFKWGEKSSGSYKDFLWSDYGSPPRVYE